MTTATRPATPAFGPREGYEWRVVRDDDWRLATPAEATVRICRHSTKYRCPNDPVAALARTRYRYIEPMDLNGQIAWFFYCTDHMYSRWIEDGQVVWWVQREIGS